ncbi:DNA mismatch repair protein hexB [Mycotypha africana]|uniref:DNA mismatch repair protein hexB n=1 Tax=Mycotypha africana TaxID=64632 RepID=UPI002300E793|nr:DNA mismatch repair protein hexB [Mycotypha africana]KAI8973504.1 DNA mismatch repair protein hexB [Mycotypha africana]
MSTIPSIKKLDQAVVNRIAAGEVIQRPANALKELIENSLDAGSTQIQILIKDGGLKLLQIQDNGHGIRKEDMAIVCERFTTSKLSKFEDLSSIATHGFRGEALASISHVAHISITTKTADSPCAYRALYADGKLIPAQPGQSADPKPCAGNNGTQITAEDLFFNVPTRRKALKSPSDEYNRILDIVSRYAIHNAGVSFACRKQGTTMADIQTKNGASILDNIRLLHGSVASELLPVKNTFDQLGFTLDGYVSNANYSVKKMTFLLFINHRAVESSSIKRAIENIYSTLLPKGGHPFIYLSLELDPKNVDVNVHPTKKEVHFLYEDKIIEAISDTFQQALESANSSRTFYTQALLPGASNPTSDADDEEPSSSSTRSSNVPEYKYVRTDSRVTTLDTFLYNPENAARAAETLNAESSSTDSSQPPVASVTTTCSVEVIKKTRVEVRLTSVLNLRKEIKKQENAKLTAILSNHTFIGCVDDVLALIQHEQSIYLVNYTVASEELIYQIVLHEFCNMGQLKLSTPVSIREYLAVALDIERHNGTLPDNLVSNEEIIESITTTLIARAEMLHEYFSFEISAEGDLLALPMIIRDYIPSMDKLPVFLLRLGTEVDWESEKQCFYTLSKELALFYSAEPPLRSEEREDYLWKVQHLIFPCFKTHFVAPSSLKEFVTPLANLADLYKIFERC